MSALVQVPDKFGRFIEARVLLDTCSTTHLITADFARKLKLPISACSIQIGAVDTLKTAALGEIEICVKSLNNNFQKSLSCLILPKISDLEPSDIFPRDKVDIPSSLRLADPSFNIPRPVDILVGCGATVSFIQSGQIKLSQDKSDLFLQKTKLGWVIVGGLSDKHSSNNATCHFTELYQILENFMNAEAIGDSTVDSSENELCEQHYVDTTVRMPSGRYKVRLPFRSNFKELGSSRDQAVRRFNSLIHKLNSNPKLKLEYSKVMQEWIDLGHMKLEVDETTPGYYIPHHAVVKETSLTTQLRIVFDAFAKSSNGLSLNDVLYTGPTIQPKLFVHLLRFRTQRIVITGDLEKMFRQTELDERDQRFQRIFWYSGDQVRVFVISVLAFGVSAAPFLAIRTLHRLADDEASSFPRASMILKKHAYVDDITTGAETVEEVVSIRDELIQLARRGGINIRKWASNDVRALEGIHDKIGSSEVAIIPDDVSKTLGVTWNSRSDSLVYKSQSINLEVKFTKRVLLSEIAKIFDPLGLLGPIVFHAKLVMQQCWRLQIDWDDQLPQDISSKWLAFAHQISNMKEVSIPRHLVINNSSYVEIHGFCDASQDGYGACLYVRSIDTSNKILVSLACSKSRVAPLKTKNKVQITIPRLELCAALLLTRLYTKAQEAFEFSFVRSIFWSDSTITLQWLQKPPELLKVFEGNRVKEIQSIKGNIEWRHIRTEDNPADALSRGQFPSEFNSNHSWFSGPLWLNQDESSWPVSIVSSQSNLPGLRKRTCLLATAIECDIFLRFSNYSTLIHSIAYCYRMSPKNQFKGKVISVEERLKTEKRIIRIVQLQYFSTEINLISNSQRVKNSKIASFDPFLDDHGLLRVGGRLRYSSLAKNHKFPILLPAGNHVTNLIIQDTHIRTLHAGNQSTLSTIRQRFWLIDGKRQVKKILRKCVVCFKHNPISASYKMADLPSFRVNQAPPFYHTGVDYFGPMYIKERKHRNRNKIKVYGAVFIDLASKFVHIELVSDLTTAAFFGAFRRFISRRGIPAHVYSDNGLNFVGANNELHELHQLLTSSQFEKETRIFSLRRNISWHFNPPESPHFGGIWEAAVKSFKHHLKRVIGGQLLTYEELETLLIEIEAILNSRPICTLSNDPNDPTALSPADIVVGRKLSTIPEQDLFSVPDNRLSTWRLITKVRQHFWRRWQLEYLHELQQRQKWLAEGSDIKTGLIVILIDKVKPCSMWELGRIIEVCAGLDGVGRVVKVQTRRRVFTRNVTSLCPLPIEA